MGAPKQKWTAEEEAALKAGIKKHGAGKWRTMLKDPEFSGILYLRSNVDLKDKWRNMRVMANGWSLNEKSKLVVKRVNPVPKPDENSSVLTIVSQGDQYVTDDKQLTNSSNTMMAAAPRRPTVRLDKLIMEAITTLKEPGGSNKSTIAAYIEEQYWPPHDFKRLLLVKLKSLTANGKLIKVKRQYQIAPNSSFSDRRYQSMLFLDGRQRIVPPFGRDDLHMPTRAEIDLELANIRNMTPQNAAAVAARAVREAEMAITEAEEAAREADAAEADAAAAQAFAEAALKTLNGRSASKMVIRAGCQ